MKFAVIPNSKVSCITQQNLLNAWESMRLVEKQWRNYYYLERENNKHERYVVFRTDFSDWSLIMKLELGQDALSGYSEIMQKIMDAIKNKNYVIVCVSGDSATPHKFKIELENNLNNISYGVILLDKPIQNLIKSSEEEPLEDDYSAKCIGIIAEFTF